MILKAGYKMFDKEKIKKGVELILEGIGEDKNREGLLETPDRIARMYEEIFAGMEQTAEEPLSKTFHVDNNEMVIEKDIVFYSTCEHHFMPFYGKAHIAYIPNDDGLVIGLSKLARIVNSYARRPQLQERLTAQIADFIDKEMNPKGVAVVVEAAVVVVVACPLSFRCFCPLACLCPCLYPCLYPLNQYIYQC